MAVQWTRETISDIIQTCTSVKDMRRRYPGAYDSMKRNGWTDLKGLIKGYTEQKPTANRWTRETIVDAMSKCVSGNDFKIKYPGAHEAMHRHGWQDLKQYIPRLRKAPQTKWTKELISDIIAKCDSIFQLRSEHLDAYSAIQRNKWHDLLGNLPRYPITYRENPTWSVYRWLFPGTDAVYIGLTNNLKRRISQELKDDQTSPVCTFLKQNPGITYQITELHSKLSSNEASLLEIAFIEKYRKDGYRVLNRNRGGTLGGSVYTRMSYSKLTDEQLLEQVIARYKTYRSFAHGSKALYNEIEFRGLMHMIENILPRPESIERKNTKEHVMDIISKCTSYSQFRKEYKYEHRVVMKNNWYDLTNDLPRNVPYPPIKKPTVDDLRPRFDEILSEINGGTMTIKSGAAELGISVPKFRKYAGTRLISATSRASRYKISEDMLTNLIGMINSVQITVAEAARRAGVPIYAFTEIAGNRIKPKSERKLSKHQSYKCGDGPKSDESIIAEVTCRYSTLSDLRRDVNLYTKVKRHGLYGQVSAMLKHSRRGTVTREDVMEAVTSSKTYTEFVRKYPSEYQAVRSNHWEDLIEHLPRKNNKSADYTYEHIYECAHKCATRTEFNKTYHSESYTAKKLGIYDEIVADIPKRSKWSK